MLLRCSSFFLREIVEYSESLVDLGSHSISGLKEVEEFCVVHLEQHASNLASQLRLRTTISDINNNAQLNQ